MTDRKTRSTVRYDANRTRAQIASATIGTVSQRGTPKISRAAAAPENSATVLARLATSRTSIAKAVQRTPNRSRMRSDRPWPVTTPSRAAISWTIARMTMVIGNSHRSPEAGLGPEHAVGGDAARIVAGDSGDEARGP